MSKFSIGVFDSGIGGLTVLKEIVQELPQHNFIYLGDNARAPYGNHDFDTVYKYTLECVEWLFSQGCPLVILACNTASAKALRSIQMKNIATQYPDKRVLGVIRPTAEVIGNYTQSNNIGVFGTYGTVKSNSYPMEIGKFFPEVQVYQQACPMWVPLIENKEHLHPGADYFIQQSIEKLLAQEPKIDTILLGCTHYPWMQAKIESYTPAGIKIISQGDIVAKSLKLYLQKHSDLEALIAQNGEIKLYTTGDLAQFSAHSTSFFSPNLLPELITLDE